MREIILPLKRTVFLPKGSPGICSVREIKADVRHFETVAEGGRVFCSGEADLLIEYLSFATGKQYPGYEGYEQELSGGGSMWQALLTVPFELTGAGDLPCPPLAELAVGEMNWFMVSPHALEMEIDLGLRWQDDIEESFAPVAEVPTALPTAPPTGWQQITLEDVMRENTRPSAQRHNLNTGKTKTKGECVNMEHDDKIMRMGVSDQGWQITTQEQEQILECEPLRAEPLRAEPPIPEPPIPEPLPIPEPPIPAPAEPETSILSAAIEEVTVAKIAIEEVVVSETVVEETVVEEVIVAEAIAEASTETITETETETVTETVAEEPLAMSVPLLNIKTVETPWQPPCQAETVTEAPTAPLQMEQPVSRSRAAGLPRLHMRHEQMRRSAYQVNIQIEDK